MNSLFKVAVRLAKTQQCAEWLAKVTQADLSLRWVHSHFVGFVMSRLKYYRLFVPSAPKSKQGRLRPDV